MSILGSFVARGAFSITPGAGALTRQAHGIYIGGSGNITVITADGDTVTFNGVVAGTILPVRCTHVTAATATGLVGFRSYKSNVN
jgi:hypothetical protein